MSKIAFIYPGQGAQKAGMGADFYENSELAAKKKHWIDFDAGQLIHGKAMPQLLEEFIDTIVEFANGKQTCNERNDFRELAIFKSGVTL